MDKSKVKPLERAEIYRRVLKKIGMSKAKKSPECQAYFTTDHLRKLYTMLVEGVNECQSGKIH
jgi:hypothetical protein